MPRHRRGASEQSGFATLWLPNIFGLDAITAAALAGRDATRIELGTAVVPTYPRHPVALAQQALTASAATSGRFTLGIGLSHKIVIEDMFGLDYSKPARHMREYLEVLTPLLRGEPVEYQGIRVPREGRARPCPVPRRVPLLVAALGPVMLGLAGRLADGTITWMTGARTLAEHIAARDSARRRAPPGALSRASSPGSRSRSCAMSARRARGGREGLRDLRHASLVPRDARPRGRGGPAATSRSWATRPSCACRSRGCATQASPTSTRPWHPWKRAARSARSSSS